MKSYFDRNRAGVLLLIMLGLHMCAISLHMGMDRASSCHP